MAFVPAPGYQPAFNPPVPYTTVIAGGLRVGMVVSIQATLPKNYNRFGINFAAGQDESSDIAFHMNARYDGRDRVVFNSKQGDVWGNEEMKKEMPFKSGKVFFIMFEVTRNNYQVFANGAPFYEFAHRIPLERVNWLQVSGDISIQELSIVGSGPGVKGPVVINLHIVDRRWLLLGRIGPLGKRVDLKESCVVSFTGRAPGQYHYGEWVHFLPMMGPPIVNAPVPFTTYIRGGMIPKRSVVVKGIVKSNAKSFIINLKASFNNDIALHLNPRLNKKTVVRNTFINGTWGEEESALAKDPFHQGEYFDISIRTGDKQFKVYVNGSHVFNFAHRLWNLQQVDKLEVEGDVNIVYVFI